MPDAEAALEVLGSAWLQRVTGESERLEHASLQKAEPCKTVQRISRSARAALEAMPSTVTFGGRHFVYARANLVAGGGGRFVQVVSAPVGENGELGAWSHFQLIRIIGYESAARGDICMFSVTPNPVDPETLLGVFPVNVPLPVHASRCVCIAVSMSADGVT